MALVRAGSAERADHPRVQFPGVPGQPLAARRRRAGTAPRTGPDARARAGRPGSRSGPGSPAARRRAASIASCQPASRPAPHQPDSSRSPVEHDREVQRLVGQRRVQGGQLSGRRARGPPAGWARRRGPSGGWQEHQADLEQADVGEAAADVADQHPQQAGQQRGAQQRLVVAERVGDPRAPGGAGRPAGSCSRSASAAEPNGWLSTST